MAESLSVVNATARRYFAGAVDETIRKRLFLRLLEKYGRISFNESGTSVFWNVEYKQPTVQAHGASGEYSFSETDLNRQLEIDVRGYVATDKMDFKNSLMNKGTVAIVDRYARIMPQLLKTLDDHFHGELYIDGTASGNTNRLHGLDTFMNGAVVHTVVAADLIANPTASYGGLSTVPQNAGGTWTSALTTSPNANIATDWPSGNGSAEYDYISPILINTTSTNWGTGSGLWGDNCGTILRRTSIWLTKNGGLDGRPTCYMMGDDLFNEYADYQEAKYRNIIPHEEGLELGFPDTLKQDGVMIKYEFDCPASQFWGINVHQMELASWDDVLFGTRGPYYDIKSDAYLFKAGFFGNTRFNPKYFAHGESYAA